MPPITCAHDSCKKRLTIAAVPCKCNNYYCSVHRGNYDHSCSFDYKNEHTKNLLKTMSSSIVAEKLARV